MTGVFQTTLLSLYKGYGNDSGYEGPLWESIQIDTIKNVENNYFYVFMFT
ncbi:hypothetical protein BTJ44_00628 [Bacillus mycoides]|nr:hypothetical protein BTJ44_00628 [Bacillus mycoides]